VLDFTDPERPRWHRVLVQGAGPSARYAHTLSLVANRFLVAMGGNDGKSTLGDAWALDTSEKPYAWRKITDAGDMPCPRMYATAAARSDGLLLLCGGRDVQGTPLADAYGFARHRDGRWEWHAAPGSMPSGRYQHGAVFVGARLHISGGAVGGGRMVDEATSTVMLDTSGGAWISPAPGALTGDDLTRRCRHAVASLGPFVFIYGGLKGSQLLVGAALRGVGSAGSEGGGWVVGLSVAAGRLQSDPAGALCRDGAGALSLSPLPHRRSPFTPLQPCAPLTTTRTTCCWLTTAAARS